MFRGYKKPRKSDIFGPSSTGWTSSDTRQRELYQEGEGLGSILSSIFRKVAPFATKAVKKIAGSSIVKDTGKALTESAVTGLTNVAADIIGADRTFEESFSDQLSNARKNISTAIKASSIKRGNESVKTTARSKGARSKGKKNKKEKEG